MPKIPYKNVCDEVTEEIMVLPVKVGGKWRDYFNLTTEEQNQVTDQISIQDDEVIYLDPENARKAEEIQKYITEALVTTVVGEKKQDQLDAENRDVATVSELLKLGPDLRSADRGGRTPLHAAAERGNADIVKLLIDAGADTKAVDAVGLTPLHLALEGGHLDASRALLQANPMTLNMTDVFGRKPIHVAAQNNDLEFFKAFTAQEGISIDEKDSQGKTVLDYALEQGKKTDLVEFLILRATSRGDKEAVSSAFARLPDMTSKESWKLWQKIKSEINGSELSDKDKSERTKSFFADFLKNEFRSGRYQSTGVTALKDIFGNNFDIYDDDSFFLRKVGEVVKTGSDSLFRTLGRNFKNPEVVILYDNISRQLTEMQMYPTPESIAYPPKKTSSMTSVIASSIEKESQDSPEIKIMRECLGEMKLRFDISVLPRITLDDNNHGKVAEIRSVLGKKSIDTLDASQVKEMYGQVHDHVNQLVVNEGSFEFQRRGSTVESPVAIYQAAKALIESTDDQLKNVSSTETRSSKL